MEAVMIAAITAIPATIAALAAYRKAKASSIASDKTVEELAVSNGHKPGFMIEQTFNAMERIESKLDSHIGDDVRHL